MTELACSKQQVPVVVASSHVPRATLLGICSTTVYAKQLNVLQQNSLSTDVFQGTEKHFVSQTYTTFAPSQEFGFLTLTRMNDPCARSEQLAHSQNH